MEGYGQIILTNGIEYTGTFKKSSLEGFGTALINNIKY